MIDSILNSKCAFIKGSRWEFLTQNTSNLNFFVGLGIHQSSELIEYAKSKKFLGLPLKEYQERSSILCLFLYSLMLVLLYRFKLESHKVHFYISLCEEVKI